MKPLISVITSVYNGADGIVRTLDSIVSQTLYDFEYIIIDDGSSDGSRETLTHYARVDRRVKVLANEKNLGLTASLNRCLSIACAPYVARIDSGDVASRDRFEKQLSFMNHNAEIGIVGSNDVAIFADYGRYKVYRRPLADESITRRLMYRNCFSHSTLMIRRSVFSDIGFYEPYYAQDYDLIIRAKKKYQIANLPDFLCVRVQSAGDITTKAWRMQELTVLNSKLHYSRKVNAPAVVKSLAFLNIPMNVARFAVPSGLKAFYNRHFSIPLPVGFDYNSLDDYCRLLDQVNNI